MYEGVNEAVAVGVGVAPSESVDVVVGVAVTEPVGDAVPVVVALMDGRNAGPGWLEGRRASRPALDRMAPSTTWRSASLSRRSYTASSASEKSER